MQQRGEYIKSAKLLRQLKRRAGFFLMAVTLSILKVVFAFAFCEDSIVLNMIIVSCIIVMVIVLSLITLSCRQVISAKLIIDNRIMHIKSAQILDQGASTQHIKKSGSEDIEVFISCFGILMDTKIIKFNLDGVLLKEVQLSDRYIILGYGRDITEKKIRILHETLTIYEMIRIIESFRYETGVTPVLIEDK